MIPLLFSLLLAGSPNDLCYQMRGARDPESLVRFRKWLADDRLRACAAANLREAGATAELDDALSDPDPDIRAAAARELGTLAQPESLPALAAVAQDPNPLVAANGIDALGHFQDERALAYLLELADRGGVNGIAALSHLARFRDARVLSAARRYLGAPDVPGRLIALGIVAAQGTAEDLPVLERIAATHDTLSARGRGFGLMPAIDLGRAAKAAIEGIRQRTQQ